MGPPRISILLPTHNRADVVGWAIESALGQTRGDFELLVMGDGCTDDTAAVVQGYADPRVRWFDFPKAPGVGYANRNRALREAKGELIAYLAHDDLWLPDHLELLAGALEAEGAELAYSQPLDVARDGRLTPQIFNLNDPYTWEWWRTKHIGYLPVCAVMHRAECFAKYGTWSDRLIRGGDWELWMRFIEGGGRRNFAYLPVPTTLHFVADWRRGTETWRKRLWRWLRDREEADLPELKISLPPGMTEQEAVWAAMRSALRAAPEDWTRAVRRAAQVDVDRRATALVHGSTVVEWAVRSYRRVRPYYKQWPREEGK